jgi:hypothetical protein
MKIRNGLVSNSSSSSFLLFLDKIPETKEELKELLFPNDTVFPNLYYSRGTPRGWPIEDVIEIIMEDFQKAEILTEEEVLEALISGYLEETKPSWDAWDKIPRRPEAATEEELEEWREKWNQAWDEYKEEKLRLAKEYYKTLPQNKKVISVEYSDSDGFLHTALEHGDTFDNIDHVRISHH